MPDQRRCRGRIVTGIKGEWYKLICISVHIKYYVLLLFVNNFQIIDS